MGESPNPPSNQPADLFSSAAFPTKPVRYTQSIWIHLLLILATFLTTALSGVIWLNLWRPNESFNLWLIFMGFPYAVAVMVILGCHEFGHYFAALYHRISVSLPYFIPFPPIPFEMSFGTMGAVIRIKSPIRNRIQLMDIGAYGPIAGFGVALLILIIAAATIPPIDYLHTIHPNYRFLSEIPGPESARGSGDVLVFGENIIFYLVLKYMLPYQIPMSEMYHYPLLLAAYLGLFITALNLLPFGQLDGGHIVYSLLGPVWHKVISWITVSFCLIAGTIGLVSKFQDIANPALFWPGWLVWGLVMLFVIRPGHPPLTEAVPLDTKRKVIAYLSAVIFILCFTPVPFDLR
ncbi:MAG: site-2 protease family protein [Bacteroidetes bacterium]|nr:site-2 protease family protein [Bacteroidota bacterium]